MEEYIVKILSIENLTHDVKRIKVERPVGYNFIPGQATEAAINKPHLREERRPFTFTGLSDWPDLEFTIKIYGDHNGVTKELGSLVPGDELILHDVWGTINYKGPGVFIAGGAGVTPFIAILRDLYQKDTIAGNTLIFSNKTSEDIIMPEEFSKMLGINFFNILTRENSNTRCRIDENYIRNHIKDFNQNFYVCGPEAFVKDIQNILVKLGANSESVIFEK